jgi:hypothetical protein
MSNQIKTRKKTKIVGKETYINKRTGKVEEMQVITIEERDANFHKIWLQHIVLSLDVIGNVKMKFVLWLLDQMSYDNLIPMTYEQMARRSGHSIETIKRTIPVLVKNDFLVRINQGVYQINPNVIFKGGASERMNVLIQYCQKKKKKKQDNV